MNKFDTVRVNFNTLKAVLYRLEHNLESSITDGDTTEVLQGVNTRICLLDDALDDLKNLEKELRAQRKRLEIVRDFIGDEQFKHMQEL